MTNPSPPWWTYIQHVPTDIRRYQAVFLDRDGVLNENRSDHVKDWSEFRFLPGSIDAVSRLTRAGVRVFVITNQAVVNRGLVASSTIEDMHFRLRRVVAAHGGSIEDIAYCPHRPEEACSCRKPQPGLLLALAEKHRLDLSRCVVVGDALADIDAGRAAGCEAIMVMSGRGKEQHALGTAAGRDLDYRLVPDLATAATVLLQSEMVYV